RRKTKKMSEQTVVAEDKPQEHRRQPHPAPAATDPCAGAEQVAGARLVYGRDLAPLGARPPRSGDLGEEPVKLLAREPRDLGDAPNVGLEVLDRALDGIVAVGRPDVEKSVHRDRELVDLWIRPLLAEQIRQERGELGARPNPIRMQFLGDRSPKVSHDTPLLGSVLRDDADILASVRSQHPPRDFPMKPKRKSSGAGSSPRWRIS